MDRTIIVPYRAEEKEMSNILYNAINGLTLIYPPTDDLRKCLSDDMFLKPNQQAFFHVMHYLFRILDAQEFKKRFFWPITDKRSESNFRTATVEYLKHINEKYQLNWTNIKSYLVVMPGGMKFISFLLDFVTFIIQDVIKQKEKQLNLDANNYRSEVSEANLHRMSAKNEFLKGMASEFIDTVENLNKKYDDKCKKLIQHLETLSQESGVSLDFLTNDTFLEGFEKCNYQLFDKYYTDRTKRVLRMEKVICELKESMNNFFCKETEYKYDKQRIIAQLKSIQNNFSIDGLVKEESFSLKATEDEANINAFISTFNTLSETIQNDLNVVNKKPFLGAFVYSHLLGLKNELQDMEIQITNFQKNLHENMKISQSVFPKTPISENVNCATKRNLENNLLMKLVSTPPIKFELLEDVGKSRLALVDLKSANNNETFSHFLAPLPLTNTRQTNRHRTLVDQTIVDLNNTMNRSKIIDPIELLRSTNKKDIIKQKRSTTQANISNSGTNWKLRETMLNEIECTTVTAVTSNDCTPKFQFKSSSLSTDTVSPYRSPFTTFSSNDCTKIAKPVYKSESSGIGGKKLSVVEKVQGDSLNFANLSTSPSGRLEPLVKAHDLDIPKMKLNDVSLFETNLSFSNLLAYEKRNDIVSTIDKNIKKIDETNASSGTVKEEIVNVPHEINQEEEEALFNISDSVLKDVTL